MDIVVKGDSLTYFFAVDNSLKTFPRCAAPSGQLAEEQFPEQTIPWMNSSLEGSSLNDNSPNGHIPRRAYSRITFLWIYLNLFLPFLPLVKLVYLQIKHPHSLFLRILTLDLNLKTELLDLISPRRLLHKREPQSE